MLAALCRHVPANLVLDEETQEKFFAVFNMMDLKTVEAARSKMHYNPASPEGYFSSSYIADRNDFAAPLGGYGPPVSINGGFYHSHETQSFKEMHSKVDQSAYGLSSPPRASERCTTSGRTNANAHRCPPYTTQERPSSPPTPPRSPYGIPTITVVDVDAVEQDLYKGNNASTATFDQPAHLEADKDAILEPSDASPINAGATEGYSSVEEYIVNNDDSGIAMDYTLNPDLEERKDDATTKDSGISFSQDSAYATQPFKDLDDDDNELNDVRFNSRSSHPPPNTPEVSVGGGALESSKQALDELAQDTRPSARLGAQSGSIDNDTTNVATNSSNPDHASAPTSSLGKRKADSNSDSDDKNSDNDITDTATTSSNPDPASVPASSLGKRKAESDSNNESDNNNDRDNDIDNDNDIDKDNDNESKGQKHNAKRVKLTES
jgi:hypothetical protein